MLKALVLHKTKKRAEETILALSSMNFECLFIDDVDSAIDIVNNEGESIHLFVANIDATNNEGTDGLKLISYQDGRGLCRPCIGLSSDNNWQDKLPTRDPQRAIHPEAVFVEGTNNQEEIRSIIDDALQDAFHDEDSPHKNHRILIIDDDEYHRNLISRRMLKWGFEPYALDLAPDNIVPVVKLNPDVIALDMNMPDTDGYTVAEILKKSTETAHIPIIAITGELHAKERCMAAGCDAFVPKPVDFRTVRKEVDRLIKNKKLSA